MLFIQQWMDLNHLKLNPGKTELVLTGNSYKSWSPHYWPPELRVPPTPSPSAKTLGITLNNDLSVKTQVGLVISKCFFQLRKIRKIYCFLTQEALIQVVIATVLSHLDYANSVYLGMSLYLFKRLQMVQNHAARLILRQPRWQSATPLLKELHWLPIFQRCAFKTGCLIFKSLHGQNPQFLNNLILGHTPSPNLRSAHLSLLSIPAFKKTRQGGCRFATLTPRLWNSFPLEIRSCPDLRFRRALKTWLFTQVYI